MSRTKITTIGEIVLGKSGALLCSLYANETGRTEWLEALPNTDNWPTLGPAPKGPGNDSKAANEEWKRAGAAYEEALHSDASYKSAVSEFMKQQQNGPQSFPTARKFFEKHVWWLHKRPKGQFAFFAYRGKVLRVESTDPEVFRVTDKLWITENGTALIKQYVLRREKQYEKAQREVEAFENMEKLEGVSREPIPESVRLFVWQRDKGQCVKCGSREKLEFDHIIPIASGGGSTERNIQLLCEPCNRSKGATI